MQVVMQKAELQEYRRSAKRQGVTLAAWVRQHLRSASREESLADPERKLAAIRAGAACDFPAPDIGQMLDEIEAGYRS